MLTILGRSDSHRGRLCDGLSRRSFLTIGGMAMGSLTLPRLLQAEAAGGVGPVGSSHKAVINVFLAGGPPHLDMWDLKPEAPREVRGEFQPIKTNVPGIEICELFPNIARMMDKFAIIRSLVKQRDSHYTYQCLTGYHDSNQPAGGRPCMGAWVSKLQGPADPAVPPHMALMYETDHRPWGYPGEGGFLGVAHAPFNLVGGRQSMKQQDGKNGKPAGASNMVLQGITLERLQDRRRLLTALDNFRRDADASGKMAGLDDFTQQAFGILTSSQLAEAMDLSKEDPKIVERYGKGDPEFRADGAPKMTENFCIARRLVEAGARVVSLNFSRWDWHGGNFKRGREDFPMLDKAVSALVSDLHERGLDKDVSVIVWGEFGRTPKINKDAGRDHWPRVNAALLAGGGMRMGQVIGATDRLGEDASDRPVDFQQVFATLYTQLGLDVGTVREFDLRGRPQYLVEPGTEPIAELL